MAGSIRRRPDRGSDAFELRIFLGRDAEGKVRHRRVLFRGTTRAAERELARLVALQTLSPAAAPQEAARSWASSTTINQAITGWRENGWQDLSPSTTRRYESLIKVHVESSIGKRTIASLSPFDIEVYLRDLKAKGLSEASVRQARAVLHRACRLARKWSGNLLPNPVADTEMPDWALHEQSDAVRAPTVDEVRRLLDVARGADHRVHAFLLLVTARQPKTRASIRTVAIHERTAVALRSLYQETERLGALGGFSVDPAHFVFSMELPGERPPNPDTYSHAFVELRRQAGVAGDVHLHSLRHFQATALDAVISERQKQARLGWATVHMARHYTDGVAEEDRRAAEHIGRLLGAEADVPQVGHVTRSSSQPSDTAASPSPGPTTSRSTAARGTRSRPLMVTKGKGKSPRQSER